MNLCADKAKPVELVPHENLWEHKFRAFGFPKDKSYGVWTYGLFQGANAKQWVQIEVKSENSFRLEQGFSGTPVWDENFRKDNAPQNLAIIRQIALNFLGREKSLKVGVKNKQFRAAMDNNYLLKVLTT